MMKALFLKLQRQLRVRRAIYHRRKMRARELRAAKAPKRLQPEQMKMLLTFLQIPAQILIILYMYFGRVGVLTISMGFLMGDRAEERFRYAETNLLIG